MAVKTNEYCPWDIRVTWDGWSLFITVLGLNYADACASVAYELQTKWKVSMDEVLASLSSVD